MRSALRCIGVANAPGADIGDRAGTGPSDSDLTDSPIPHGLGRRPRATARVDRWSCPLVIGPGHTDYGVSSAGASWASSAIPTGKTRATRAMPCSEAGEGRGPTTITVRGRTDRMASSARATVSTFCCRRSELSSARSPTTIKSGDVPAPTKAAGRSIVRVAIVRGRSVPSPLSRQAKCHLCPVLAWPLLHPNTSLSQGCRLM